MYNGVIYIYKGSIMPYLIGQQLFTQMHRLSKKILQTNIIYQ